MTFKETILQQAMDLFQKSGIAAFTISDIAKALDINQGTMDELFKDKEDLVLQAVKFQAEVDRERQKKLIKNADNALEELLLLIQDGLSQMKNLNPHYINDVMQYESVQRFTERSLDDYSYPMIYNILNKGVQQGVFLMDINLAIVSRIVIQEIYIMLNTKVFSPEKYSIREVYRSIYLYYFRGLCTLDAITKAEQIFNKTLSS